MALVTTWKRGVAVDIEVLLEVTLAITAKSAFGTEIVVSVVAGALDFVVGAVDVMLLLEMDVMSELVATSVWEAETSVVGLELAGASDAEGEIVGVVGEAVEVVISELVGLLDLEVGVIDTALDSVEEVCLVVPAAEVPSELMSVLTLDVDLLDVPETEFEAVDLAPEVVCVTATSEVPVDLPLEALEVLGTGSPLDEVIVKLFMVPENVDSWLVVS